MIVGARIVSVAEGFSPPGLPFAVIAYGPSGWLATRMEPVRIPFETEHVNDAIAPPSVSVHVVSPGENPDPETATVEPT